MEGVERYKVRLIPHNPEWSVEFSEVKRQIEELWSDQVIDVQHIGSTSVLGIWAKPILDVAIVVKSFATMDIEALVKAGYEFCGLQEPDNDRYLFVLRGEEQLSLRHVHVYEPNNLGFRQCLGFRDYLNSHPSEACQYSDLKRGFAAQYPDDRFAYGDAKAIFIQTIYDKLSYPSSEK